MTFSRTVTTPMRDAANTAEYYFHRAVDFLQDKFPDCPDDIYARYLVAYVAACSSDHRDSVRLSPEAASL